MKALRLKVNGREVATAGSSDAVMLMLRCTYSVGGGRGYYTLSATSRSKELGKFEELIWADDVAGELSALDLAVVDTEAPDAWRNTQVSPHSWKQQKQASPYCSFCGKTEGEAKRLLRGPGVHICEACAKLAFETMESEGAYANV
ncbi:ClpX C4-type zinc finger protein [Thiosocius teredinicola]|uniref:ClpX C4-type zinc finger protein n=1 Tax=Thiosocius teredinicola TaxID=1973002 RepID=UPI000F780644